VAAPDVDGGGPGVVGGPMCGSDKNLEVGIADEVTSISTDH